MSKIPSPLNFPKVFNPHAVDLWFAACAKTDPKSVGAWTQVLKDFTHLCARADLDPYYKGEWNSAIQHFLWTRRRHFVRYADLTKLVQGVKVIRLIHRAVDFTHFGFELTISAQCHIPDPTWMKRLFNLGPAFRFSKLRDSQRHYVRHLDPGLEVFVYNDTITGVDQWHIGYVIKCPLMPETHGQDKKQYVLDQLWGPIRSKIKPRNADNTRYL